MLSLFRPLFFFFFFNDTATTEIYTLSLHDALPILIIAPLDESIRRGGIVKVRLGLSGGPMRFAKFGAHGYPVFASRQPLVQGAEDAGRLRRRTRTRVRRQRNLTWSCGSGRCSSSL